MVHRVVIRSILAAIAAVMTVSIAVARPAPPDFGVMLNDDGDFSFTDLDPAKSDANLRAMVRSLEGTPVKTLVYSIATGSDILLYPSEAGSVYGWRQSAGEAKKPWDKRMPVMRAAVANQLDAVRTAGEEARAMGMLFVPTFRMNDAHFVSDPEANVLTGRFWLESHEGITLGSSPMKGYDGYAKLLDYSHEKVRAHRLSVIREAIDRYADVMDGFQLDFMRHPLFFPAEHARERAPLMTEVIAEVRRALDEAGARVGRPLALQVRVPPTLKSCRWSGLEVERWMRERLVDVVIPSPAMTMAQDMPIDEFVAIAKPAGATVYPALFDRTQFDWPITLSPTPQSYTGVVDRDVSAAQARAFVLNSEAMGGAGIELYNFNLPADAPTEEVLAALAAPAEGERAYTITPAYWLDDEDAFENRKQIPAALQANEPASLTLYVGETPSSDGGERWVLRIGIHGLPNTADADITVALNGEVLLNGRAGHAATPVAGKPSRSSKLHPPDAQAYLQFPIDPATIRQGENRIQMNLNGRAEAPAAQIVELQLAAIR